MEHLKTLSKQSARIFIYLGVSAYLAGAYLSPANRFEDIERIGFVIGAFVGDVLLFLLLTLVAFYGFFKRAQVGFVQTLAIALILMGIYKVTDTAVKTMETQREQVQAAEFLRAGRALLIGAPPSVNEDALGDLAPTYRAIEEFARGIRAEQFEFQKAVAESSITDMLTPENMSDPGSISRSRERLSSLNSQIDRTQSNMLRLIGKLDSEFASAKVSDRMKHLMKKGFKDSMDASAERMGEFYRIERHFVAAADELLGFLQTRQGKYWESNGQLMFESQDDLAVFNSHVERITRLANEEQNWMQAAQSRLAQKVGEADTLLERVRSEGR